MIIRFLFQISLAFRCARIEGLDGSEGILIFGREHFYILEGYTYNTEKNEIVDLDKCRNEYIPLIPKSSSITSSDSIQFRKECSKFAYEDIKEVHKRRHILQVGKILREYCAVILRGKCLLAYCIGIICC